MGQDCAEAEGQDSLVLKRVTKGVAERQGALVPVVDLNKPLVERTGTFLGQIFSELGVVHGSVFIFAKKKRRASINRQMPM